MILVPGLWMPAVLMRPLAARLNARGYQAAIFDYPGRDAHERNVEALARFARDDAFFVGHSLGGLLILDMLARHPEIAASAVVLVGAPVRGCFAGRRLGSTAFGRWMMGASAPLWEERAARWTRATPLGVVAGTLPVGLGRLFGALPGANDGVVCVDETAVDGMTERVLVPHGHSMQIFSGRVASLVSRFLGSGKFT